MLKDRIQEILDYINDNSVYTEHNKELIDIFEGNLKPYVEQSLRSCLSEEYYTKIKDRIIVINILKRYIDKVSKVYALTPVRTIKEGNSTDAKLLKEYEEIFDINVKMNDADEYSNLFKGYTLKPFIVQGEEPSLRVVPFDRFLVMNDTAEDPLKKDVYIEFMGERLIRFEDRRKANGYKEEMREVYYIYTDEEFLAIDHMGKEYEPAMVMIENYENPYGFIPSFYGNRAKLDILPTQDTDILNITKIIPVLLSDLSGAILFQCFSILYGIDVDSENLVMSPNGFWSFKSDKTSDKTPQIGVIKPQADIDKVLNFIMQVFTFWLETKGVKVGNVGNIDASTAASGIAKIIDEMDTTEIKKLSIKSFKADEKKFWKLMSKVHNHWVDQGLVLNKPRFSEEFSIEINFDEPKVVIDREKEVRTISLEVTSGFCYPEKAITKLYPDADQKEVAKHLSFYFNKDENGEMAERENQDSQGLFDDREKSDSSGDN